MKTFKNMMAQGDVMLRRINKIPTQPDVKEVEHKGYVIVTHSETGHHHSITAAPSVVQLFGSSNPRLSYMEVKAPVQLKHERPWNTHETWMIEPGTYEVRRQREASPWGDRTVQD